MTAANGDDPDPPLDAPFGPIVARFDLAFDEVLDHLRGHPVPDLVFVTASKLGDWSVLWHLIGAARGLTSDPRATEAFRLSAVLGIESLVVNQGVKRLFRRTRPHTDDRPIPGLRSPTTSSFPSGHASAAFCAATVLSAGRRSTAPAWFALAGIVALSRPYLRLHHGSDMVAGAALGTAIGLVARRVWRLHARP